MDSGKATFELPAEESGIITLKAEANDDIKVGSVVCLIWKAKKPVGSEKADTSSVVGMTSGTFAITNGRCF